MEIKVKNLYKRYLYEWIIKDLTYDFRSNSITGVNGINGSGKSTFIKLLSGFLSPSKGEIEYNINGDLIERNDIYKQVSLAAPYTDIIQEYEVEEMFEFHKKIKPFRQSLDIQHFLEIVRLQGNRGKQIQFYSSGMKQRLQLALAVLSDTKILLLDEPTSYLDAENKAWFYELLKDNISNRTVVIASNDIEDFGFCEDVLEL